MDKPTGSWEILSITFKSDIIYRNDSDLRHLFNFNISNHLQGQQILQLKKEDADFLGDISGNMRLVYNEWTGKSREDSFYHWICLFLIYCEKLQTSSPTQNEPIDEDTHTILKFNDLLEQNYKSERSVSFYVNHLNITLKMLSRITHDRYKISPKQVITRELFWK